MSVNLGNDTKAASPVRTPDEGKESKYEPKQNKKIVRLLTVIAYVISVSMAAIILSLYYVFLWDPQMKYPSKLKQGSPANKNSHLFDDNRPALNSLPFSSHEEIAAATSMREGQPTPNILPIIKDGYEAVHTAHHTPTQPLSAFRSDLTQGSGTDTSLGHSSHHQPHRTNSRDQQHYEQQQQRHHQQQQLQHHHQQQQQQQQQALTALA
nr:mastermind-like domain-containing protein 1 [Procambarus clarkii]